MIRLMISFYVAILTYTLSYGFIEYCLRTNSLLPLLYLITFVIVWAIIYILFKKMEIL